MACRSFLYMDTYTFADPLIYTHTHMRVTRASRAFSFSVRLDFFCLYGARIHAHTRGLTSVSLARCLAYSRISLCVLFCLVSFVSTQFLLTLQFCHSFRWYHLTTLKRTKFINTKWVSVEYRQPQQKQLKFEWLENIAWRDWEEIHTNVA